MADINITQADALRLLQEAVAVKGAEYVYEIPDKRDGYYGSCMYTDKDSNPSCIVGYALANAGVPIEVLHAIDWGGAVALEFEDYDDQKNEILVEREQENGFEETSITDEAVQYWLKHEGVYIDDAALDVFTAAQREQDKGVAWGTAVDKAVKYAGRNGR